MIKLSPWCKRWKTRLAALAVMITRRLSLAGPTYVSVATAATLALALTAFAGAPVSSAPGSAQIATRAQSQAHIANQASAQVRVPAPVTAAMETLTGTGFFYNPAEGFLDAFWRQAVAMSAVEAYRQTTGDTAYDYTFAALDKPAYDFENAYNDDTAWWGLALLQGYSITHDPTWLQDAKDIADYIGKTWNTTVQCPLASGGTVVGGVSWHRPGPQFGYTGAIQNGLFLELTAWLHNTIVESGGKDSTYLNWAKKEWTFFLETELYHPDAKKIPRGFSGPSTGLDPYVVPNASPDLSSGPNDQLCGGLRYRIFTYNQGVLIAGLVQLYRAMNNDPVYLTYAENIANAVLKPPTPAEMAMAREQIRAGESPWVFTLFDNGVLIEPQDSPAFSPACCLGDGAAFKGIFVRDLRMLDDTIASKSTPKAANSGPQCTATYDSKSYNQCTTMYSDFFTKQACSIEANDTSTVDVNSIGPGGVKSQPYQFLGDHWTGPNAPQDVTTQVSAVEALVAAVHVPGRSPGSFPDCQPGQRSSGEPGTTSAPSPRHERVGFPRHERVGFPRHERFGFPRHERFSLEDGQGKDQ